MAVSFDDAWNTQIIPNHTIDPVVSAKLAQETATVHPESPPEPLPRPHAKRARRQEERFESRRRRVESSESDSEDSECDSVSSVQKSKSAIEQELRDLRSIYESSQHINNVILYVAAATVIILLITVFHTQSRLQYTTECLLWYLKSSKVSA